MGGLVIDTYFRGYRTELPAKALGRRAPTIDNEQ
jgi:hypothetical protein